MAKRFLGKLVGMMKPKQKQTSDSLFDDDWQKGFPIEGLPADILFDIFSHCPARFLILTAPRVSKKWREISGRPTLWRLKCDVDGVAIPDNLPLEFTDYKRICLKNPFGRNLLKNWDASDDLKHWAVKIYGHDDGVIVEDSIMSSAHGSQPLVELDIGTTQCWATSYQRSILSQTVNLVEEGLTPEILDGLQPHIRISVWTAARFDCASTYEICVTLLDEKGNKLADQQFSDKRKIQQWGDHAWAQITHTFREYGKGVRQLQFEHGGKDRQFWAGHYGPKMAAPSVRIECNVKERHNDKKQSGATAKTEEKK